MRDGRDERCVMIEIFFWTCMSDEIHGRWSAVEFVFFIVRVHGGGPNHNDFQYFDMCSI